VRGEDQRRGAPAGGRDAGESFVYALGPVQSSATKDVFGGIFAGSYGSSAWKRASSSFRVVVAATSPTIPPFVGPRAGFVS